MAEIAWGLKRSARIGKEKTSKQLCGGVIREISACDLEPAARGSGSQVRRWLLHDSLWVELNTRGVELRMKLAKTAVDEGGSSDKNITEFAAELARKFHETKDSKV